MAPSDRRQRRGGRGLGLLMLAFVTCWWSPSVSAQPRPPRTVLAILMGTDDRGVSISVVNDTLREVLQSRADLPVEYFREYLTIDGLAREDAHAGLRDSIRRKYQGRRIDVVIAHTNQPLDFVLRYRQELFPNTPIVFSGIRRPDITRDTGGGITGVDTDTGFRQTLELALRLHPSTRRVYVIARSRGQGYLDLVRTALKPFSERVQLSYITDLSLPQVVATVKSLPADGLVLYITYSQGEPSSVLAQAQVDQLIAEASSVPVYGTLELYVGTGMVGGVVRTIRGLAIQLATMAMRVLDGERAQDIPIESAKLVPMFDWRQMRKWGVDRSQLPPDSEIRFREPTVWERYQRYIIGVGVLVVAQSALIGALLVQRRRRRRAEVALRDSEAHFRTMADTAPVMVWRSAIDKKCDFFNLPWLTFTGRPLADQIGDGWVDSVHPDDREAVVRTYNQAFDARAPFRMEYRLRRYDGEYRWVLDTGVPRLPSGLFAGYIGSCLDITDRRQAELSLQEAQAELARVSRLTALGEFAASIAHEVRQPLTAIITSARASLRFLSSGATTEAREALSYVLDAGKRADEVIERNRELFRSHTVRTERLDINSVVNEAMVMTTPKLQSGRVTLSGSLDEHLPLVDGDRLQLQQVLVNLIVNAVDAMSTAAPASRRLEISTAVAATGGVEVSVRDTGVGLGAVDLQKMFTLSYTTKASGTGVGLSISRSIVEAHGGRLWAEQNETSGATFRFTLPTSAALPSAPHRIAG